MHNQPIKASDHLVKMGLPPDVLLQATLLCNSLRLAVDASELAVALAQSDGVLAGLHLGKTISQAQNDQLQELFELVARNRRTALEEAPQLNSTIDAILASSGADEAIQGLLADTIRDLARQVTPEFRGQFYGECRGLLKALRLADTLDEAQREQWSADIYRASLQAAEQCAAAGQPADLDAVNRQRFQLELLAERGITPRAELPR